MFFACNRHPTVNTSTRKSASPVTSPCSQAAKLCILDNKCVTVATLCTQRQSQCLKSGHPRQKIISILTPKIVANNFLLTINMPQLNPTISLKTPDNPNTYKTVTRPILEYAGTIYAPIISDKQLTALQVTQNQGLRIATGCTSDTNINHIHDETKILPIEKHLRLHSSQLRQKASHPDHPLHRLTTQPQPPRLKKKTIFNNYQYTLNIDPDPTHAIDENTIKRNMKTIHTTIVQDHLSNRPINKLLNRPPPDIDKKEETLPHSTRRKLSQLRTNKSPLLMTYLHKIDPANHPAANCPLCNDPNHDSLHLFNCPDIPTTLTVWDLWTNPVGVAALLDVWGEKLGGPRAGVWDPVRAHAWDGVDTTTTPDNPPNRCRPLRGWKTRPEKERRGRPNRHHSIPAPRERGLIQPFFRWAGPWTPSCGWGGFWPYRGMSRRIPDRQPRLGLATCVRQK